MLIMRKGTRLPIGPATATELRKGVIHVAEMTLILLCCLAQALALPIEAQEGCNEEVVPRVRIDPGHPWRPPFGLERVGQPVTAVVEITSEQRPLREYSLAGYLNGKEVKRHVLHLSKLHPHMGQKQSGKAIYAARVTFSKYPAELVLFATCRFQGEAVELVRKPLEPPAVEAEAAASPDELIHPVDLGTILVPADWLLLAGGQNARVDVAAISRARDVSGAKVMAWFESAPQEKASTKVKLGKNSQVRVSLQLPGGSLVAERDVLHVSLQDESARELWHKQITTMRVTKSPQWPEFGATETKLRYDAPISVRDPETGALSSMNYTDAWPAHLNDVVVSLPNGSRFVFWRGASYVPFWAGKQNTGFNYQWAETPPPPEGFADAVEPLMDKELRYGQVEIVASTAARVHVRWTYQSTDFEYKVFGDAPVEDFYFYPDGFGTRVLTLRSAPGARYQLSEFIILTPQAMYPFSVLPRKLVDLLYIDGQKHELSFPHLGAKKHQLLLPASETGESRGIPLVYRIRLHKEEAATAIYFNPSDTNLPRRFGPFFDRGYMVTPAYWGSHWPLARGKTTGYAIDDRIYHSPAHNSVLAFGIGNSPISQEPVIVEVTDNIHPRPISRATFATLDALGQSKTMDVQRWVWLIGMTDASDARLLDWARSFTQPPSLEIKGARFAFDSYLPERRAIRLIVEDQTVAITIKPATKCVNPVFELIGAPEELVSVTLAERPLKPMQYAWDGETLWLKADIDEPAQLQLKFRKRSR